MILTKQTLDKMRCAIPGCTHENHDELFIHSRCHPKAATWVNYNLHKGILTVSCAVCKTTIAEIAVANSAI